MSLENIDYNRLECNIINDMIQWAKDEIDIFGEDIESKVWTITKAGN